MTLLRSAERGESVPGAVDTESAPDRYWATELPLPRAHMLLGRKRAAVSAFPFDQPNVQYVHFARNAIYFLARQRGLAGAEVLMPAYFHGVELEALLAAGVRPRFYPVHDGMRVDAQDIVRSLTAATRAVYLIHYVGFPGPAEELQTICRERGLMFIEDCALALLSKAGARPLGSFGDAAVFCLYKTLPTPDGGAVVLKEGRLRVEGVAPNFVGTARETAVAVLRAMEGGSSGVGRRMARAMRLAGKAAVPVRDAGWVEVGTQHFEVADTNLLMSGISKRIIAAQDFARIVQARRRNFQHLASLLEDLSQPVFPSLSEGVCPLFYPFVTERKHELWTRLHAEGVQAVLFWLGGESGPPAGAFPEVDRLRRTVLELPCHQDMTPEGIERVAGIVRRAVRELGG